MGSFGETLRQARLDKGVTLTEAERDTRIRRRYLEGLENEDHTNLPAPVYTRGIIRSYARYLGLGPESMVDLFQAAKPREERIFIRAATSHSLARRQVSLRAAGLVLGAILVTALLVVAWNQYKSVAESIERVEERQANRTQVPGGASVLVGARTAEPNGALASQPAAVPTPPRSPTPTATPTPDPTAVPTPVRGIVVETRLVATTWVEAWIDGEKVLAETLPAGTSRRFNAEHSLRMRAANGAAIEVTENGVTRGPLDASGRPVEVRWAR